LLTVPLIVLGIPLGGTLGGLGFHAKPLPPPAKTVSTIFFIFLFPNVLKHFFPGLP